MSFHYAPEQWDYHVTDLGADTRWTAKNASPDHTHLLNIFVGYPDNDTTLTTNEHVKVQCDVYMKFKCQFRETNTALKYYTDTTIAS